MSTADIPSLRLFRGIPVLAIQGIALAKSVAAIGNKHSKESLFVLKRVLAILLTGTMLTMAFGFHQVTAQTGSEDPNVARVRMDVLKVGVGDKARVEVKLRDKRKLKGYIGETAADSFTLVDSENGSSQEVTYADVAKVKKAGGGFSTRSWIILGAAVAGAVATWVIVKPALCDGGAQTRGPC